MLYDYEYSKDHLAFFSIQSTAVVIFYQISHSIIKSYFPTNPFS